MKQQKCQLNSAANQHESHTSVPAISAAGCTSFLELAQTVPRLLKFMMTASLKCLLAVNKALRQLVEQRLSSIFVPNSSTAYEDALHLTKTVRLLAQRQWERLVHLKLQPVYSDKQRLRATDMTLLCTACWPALTSLDLTSQRLSFEVVSCLVSVHCPHLLTLKLAGTTHDKPAVEKLLNGNWPLLHTLDLSRNRLSKRFFERMVQGNRLLHLKHLNLADTSLNLAAILHFVHFQAPLESLDIGRNTFSAQGVKTLSQGKWRLLKHLDCSSCGLAHEAFGHLFQADWPVLQSLNIVKQYANYDFSLGEAGTLVLCSRKWLHLAVLDLTSLKLTTESLNQLVQGRWGNLRRLCLSHCDLHASAACYVLQRGEWPVLQEFVAMSNGLQAADVSQLIECCWPHLTVLDLSYNQLDVQAITCLANGSWPLLAKLSLEDNCFRDTSLWRLTLGEWPQSKEVHVGPVLFHPKKARLKWENEHRWQSLQKLDLCFTKLSIQGIEYLLKNCQPLIDSTQLSEHLSRVFFDCQHQDLLLDIACPRLCPRHWHCLLSVKLRFRHGSHPKPSTLSLYPIHGYEQHLSIHKCLPQVSLKVGFFTGPQY